MSFEQYDVSIKQLLNSQLEKLEQFLDSDVLYFNGNFYPGISKIFRDFVEALKLKEPKSDKETLTIIISSQGGTAEDVEKIVEIIRHHYRFVNFIIPDFALSAATIFVMSGDKIYMDYASSLGPIDPQVINKQNHYVPAMGYLDKISEIYERADQNLISNVDYAFINNIDLAELRKYEQARDLSIKLVKDFLVKYKFRSWTLHATHDPGTPVTDAQKEARAKEIADQLCNNSIWLAHGRYIGIHKLTNELGLKIEDYGSIPDLQELIRTYNDLMTGYIVRNNYDQFFHTRKFII